MEVGVDIIEIDRIEAAAKNPRFLERVYTLAERERCLRRRKPGEELAGRFAAKEAVIKCLGRRVPWKQIEILSEPSGKPYVKLHGQAELLCGGRIIRISISHSRAFAVATALMEDSSAEEPPKESNERSEQ